MKRTCEKQSFANLLLQQDGVSDEGADEDQLQMVQSITAFKEGRLLVDESYDDEDGPS